MAWRKVLTLFCHLIKARLFTGKGIIKWQHVYYDNLLHWHLNMQLAAEGRQALCAALYTPRASSSPQEENTLSTSKLSSYLVGWYRASSGRCQWNKFTYCLMSADVQKATSWRWALQITWQLWILSMPRHFLIIRSLKHKQNSPALIFAVLALVQYVMWFVCIYKYCLCSQEADKAWMYLYHREGLL